MSNNNNSNDRFVYKPPENSAKAKDETNIEKSASEPPNQSSTSTPNPSAHQQNENETRKITPGVYFPNDLNEIVVDRNLFGAFGKPPNPV
ncbi:hypothetical protein TRFO_04078 [Tritrichomonas foetus]|uniref:Uncharacterized protein n=1 Tax=Tritrichomonas foetus TaxID=1144522 RepID=A0A1J4KN42_9EUKA|nr:hypothetical protein TRFO_04078 [Tritrichomonas foetus]|eukprot:OHT11118.1 hypothetical protein TRFO_04078 [Tritrichomonas foetus]